MFRTATCGCCENYEALIEAVFVQLGYNFKSVVIDGEKLRLIKIQLGVPEDYMSCHTIATYSYFIEGHVPLKAVKNTLKKRPEGVAGLAALHSELNKDTWESYHYYIIYLNGTIEKV